MVVVWLSWMLKIRRWRWRRLRRQRRLYRAIRTNKLLFFFFFFFLFFWLFLIWFNFFLLSFLLSSYYSEWCGTMNLLIFIFRPHRLTYSVIGISYTDLYTRDSIIRTMFIEKGICILKEYIAFNFLDQIFFLLFFQFSLILCEEFLLQMTINCILEIDLPHITNDCYITHTEDRTTSDPQAARVDSWDFEIW